MANKVKQLNINGTIYDLDTKASNLYTDTTIRDLKSDELFNEKYLGTWSIQRDQVSYFSNMPVSHTGMLYITYADADDGAMCQIFIDSYDTGIYQMIGYQDIWESWTRVDAGGVDTSDKVSKSGDTMTGNLTINNDAGATISLTNSNGYPASSLSNTQLSINGDSSNANLYIGDGDIPVFNMSSANTTGQVDMTANEIKVGKAGDTDTYYSKLTYDRVTVNGQNSRNAELTPEKLSITYNSEGYFAWLNAGTYDPHLQLEYQGQSSKLNPTRLELNGLSDSNDGFTTGSGALQLRADNNKPYVLLHQVGNADNYAKLACDSLNITSTDQDNGLTSSFDYNGMDFTKTLTITMNEGSNCNLTLKNKGLAYYSYINLDAQDTSQAKIKFYSDENGGYESAFYVDTYGNAYVYNDDIGTKTIAYTTNIPTSLKCPNALTLTVGGSTYTYDGSSAKKINLNTYANSGIEVEYVTDGYEACDWSSAVPVSDSIPNIIHVKDADFDSYMYGTICHLDYYYAKSGYFAYSAIVDGHHTYGSSAYSTTPVIVTYYNDNPYSADNILRKVTPIGTAAALNYSFNSSTRTLTFTT